MCVFVWFSDSNKYISVKIFVVCTQNPRTHTKLPVYLRLYYNVWENEVCYKIHLTCSEKKCFSCVMTLTKV